MIDKKYECSCNVFIDYNDDFRNALFVNKFFQTFLETFSSKIKIVHYSLNFPQSERLGASLPACFF